VGTADEGIERLLGRNMLREGSESTFNLALEASVLDRKTSCIDLRFHNVLELAARLYPATRT